MMLTEEQLLKIRLLSDVELYDQAVGFMAQFGRTIPASQINQINGLVNITKVGGYSDVLAFVEHQQGRIWPEKSRYMKAFYTGLAGELRKVRQLADREFRLKNDQQHRGLVREEGVNTLMLLLVREFIQHLAAENGYREGKRWIEKTVSKDNATRNDKG